MGWKTVKERYRISGLVFVAQGRLCVAGTTQAGVPVIEDCLQVTADGQVLAPSSPDMEQRRVIALIEADRYAFVDRLASQDKFSASHRAYTFDDEGGIVLSPTETVHWSKLRRAGVLSVTHTGELMVEQRFSSSMTEAARQARRHLEWRVAEMKARLLLRDGDEADLRQQLSHAEACLEWARTRKTVTPGPAPQTGLPQTRPKRGRPRKTPPVNEAELLPSEKAVPKGARPVVEIQHRDTGKVLFSTKVPHSVAEGGRIGFAVQRAVEAWVDLSGADLRGACLVGLRLRAAKLEGADMEGADLSGSDLSYAKLSRVSMGRAKVAGCLFEGAKLVDADLRAILGDGTDFYLADLHGIQMDDELLERARLASVPWHKRRPLGRKASGKRPTHP